MYQDVKPEDELRQGDIFIELPWLLFDPSKVGTQSGVIDIADSGFAQPASLLIQAEPGPGIIISADCNCANDAQLTVCRIFPITAKEPTFYDKELKAQLKLMLDYQRKRVGIYYLRPVNTLRDSFIEFSDHYPLKRDFLLRYRLKRITTLTEEARHHLREKIAHHHTRFGPDERYLFSATELPVIEKDL